MKDGEVEIMDETALTTPVDLVAAGAALVRLENQTQMVMAIQRKRDEEQILRASLKELDLYPSLAEEAIYRKPVGKDDSGIMKYAEGLSIRTAESLANRWGNNAYGCEIVSEDKDVVILAAVYLDYETNTRTVLQQRVSKLFKRKSGQIERLSPDRLDIVVAANRSKILREVILRRLPAGLKKEYELRAREVLAKKEPVEIRRKKMVDAFTSLKVSMQQLETIAGKPIAELDHDAITDLKGIYNALKDGEITLEALLEEKQGPQELVVDCDPTILAAIKQLAKAAGYNDAKVTMLLGQYKGKEGELKAELEALIKPPAGTLLPEEVDKKAKK